MKLKPSFYNFYLNIKGRSFIYNALSTSIIELDNNSTNNLESGNISSLNEVDIQDLHDQGFIVEEQTDELSIYQHYFNCTRYCKAQNHMSLVIIPTYGCNLRCPYCYEGEKKCNRKMSIKDMDAILNFVKKKISESQEYSPLKDIFLLIYGGEPLLCQNELDYFCTGLDEICSSENIALRYLMTSNFTLVDESTINFLKKHNIHTQVSIDGSKPYHDKRRIDATGNGTYDIIINNLKKMCDAGLKDSLTIRINTDNENIQDIEIAFKELITYSEDVYFGILVHYNGFNDCYTNTCINDSDITESHTQKIDNLYKKYGLPIPRRFGKKSPCAICGLNRFMFDPNLDVYKCDLLVNHKECSVGKLDNDGILNLNPNYYHQTCHTPFRFEKCRKCKLLPACAGGCPAKQYISLGKNDGFVDLICCEMNEEDFIQYLEKYIELNFL